MANHPEIACTMSKKIGTMNDVHKMGCLFEGLLCQQNCSTTKKKLIACTDHYLGKYVLTSKMKILKRSKPLQHFCQ